MVHIVADRVLQTATTTGTGALTLSGTPTGYRALSAVCATGDTLFYTIENPNTAEWECGIGTYSASNTLTRTTVLSSSNANSAVNFSAGTKNVFIDSMAPSLDQYYRLNTDFLGANATGAQSLFGKGITLAAGVAYEFDLLVTLVKTAGTNSHTIALGFGGTATLNNMAYTVKYAGPQAFGSGAALNSYPTASGSSVVFTGPIVTAGVYMSFDVRGTVSVSASGTLIPQYTLSAAPGGAYYTSAGALIRVATLGPSGANVSVGNWV